MSQSIDHPIDQKSIAVLPFANLSAEEEKEYFCDGLTEEVINVLSKIEDLKVTARASTFVFKGETTFQEIAAQLGVNALLKGSIRFAKNRFRISVQMINASDGFNAWSESFDGFLEDVFAVQDEISLKIADRIREHLGHFEIEEQVFTSHKIPLSSYKLYLKARFLGRQLNRPDLEEAIRISEEVIQQVPRFPLAYLEAHAAYNFLAALGVIPKEKALAKGQSLLNTAITLNRDLPECQYQLAQIAMWQEWDLEKACGLLKKAIKGKPSYADAHQLMSLALVVQHNYSAAKYYLDIAMQLNPFDAHIHYQMGALFYYQKKYEEALTYFSKCRSIDPDFLFAHIQSAATLVLQGKTEEALAITEKLPPSSAADLSGIFIQTIVHLKQAKQDAAALGTLKLESALATAARERAMSLLIYVYTASGDYDKAFALLEEAVSIRVSMLLFFAQEPLLEPLHQQAKFQELMQQVIAKSHTFQLPSKIYKKPLLEKAELKKYRLQLEELMTDQELYLDADLSLRGLAAKLPLHPNALSQLLNQEFKKNFSEFVNSYRLEAFKQKASDPKYQHLTILALAYDSGFNSKTTFNVFFKKMTGKTPSQYWKENVKN